MKTRIQLLLLALLSLLLAPVAHAYYNPSSGRWLSRDPATDAGFLREKAIRDKVRSRQDLLRLEFNPLLAIGNDLISMHDYLGLEHRKSCCPELNLWTPCSVVCRLAWRDREANHALASTGGTVICYHGKACGCVGSWNSIGFDPGRCPGIDSIVQQHEDNHAKKAKCKPCGLHAAGAPDEFPGVDLKQEECEQRRLTIKELKALMGPLEEDCEKLARAMIASLEEKTKDCPE